LITWQQITSKSEIERHLEVPVNHQGLLDLIFDPTPCPSPKNRGGEFCEKVLQGASRPATLFHFFLALGIEHL
jgi:hypothetical protein